VSAPAASPVTSPGMSSCAGRCSAGSRAAGGWAWAYCTTAGSRPGWPHGTACPPRHSPSPRARLDLALALTATDKHDEAAGVTLEAIQSGRLAPVDDRRAREIVLAVAERGVPEAAELAEAYQAACGDGGSRPALP
jgi:hypothetical protein